MTRKSFRVAFLIALVLSALSLLATLKLVYSADPDGPVLKLFMLTFLISATAVLAGWFVLLYAAIRDYTLVVRERRARRW